MIAKMLVNELCQPFDTLRILPLARCPPLSDACGQAQHGGQVCGAEIGRHMPSTGDIGKTPQGLLYIVSVSAVPQRGHLRLGKPGCELTAANGPCLQV